MKRTLLLALVAAVLLVFVYLRYRTPPDIVLEVSAAGEVRLDGQAVPLTQLTGVIEQRSWKPEAQRVVIRVEESARSSTLVDVMQEVSDAGVTDVQVQLK